MKNILIYINDSLGELDWIAPFMNSKEGREFTFYIFLNGPGKNYDEKRDILKIYGLVGKNIKLLNQDKKLDRYLFKIDNFMNKLLARTQKYSKTLFQTLRTLVDSIRYIVGKLYHKDKEIAFDYIFRDYNLKESFILSAYLCHNSAAKIIIYPHAVGIQKKHPSCPREAIKEVAADLWLENSYQSDLIKESVAYKDIFFPAGAPSLSANYHKKSLFNIHSKTIIILTRDCGKVYGFEYAEAFVMFEEILKKAAKLGLTTIVKHHPRDKKIAQWRALQDKYLNVRELEGSLNDLNTECRACFTLFSTAALFVLSREIPVLEFTPYKSCKEYDYQMPFHYCRDDGKLTHDLLALDLFERFDYIDSFEDLMESSTLSILSRKQYDRCREIFPDNASKHIANKLIEIVDEK